MKDSKKVLREELARTQGGRPGRSRSKADGNWRPPDRASREVHTKRLITAVAVSLVVSAVLLWFFARVAGGGGSNVRLGDREFKVGGWKRTAAQIDKDGPVFFNDLVVDDNVRRPVVLTHLVEKDFAALNALPPGSTKDSCVVQYDRVAKNFLDPCTSNRFALDGKGIGNQIWLERFVTDVNVKGALSIDLNREYPEDAR